MIDTMKFGHFKLGGRRSHGVFGASRNPDLLRHRPKVTVAQGENLKRLKLRVVAWLLPALSLGFFATVSQAAEPWTLVVIPDAQHYVIDGNPPLPLTERWDSQMNWIVNNRDSKNLRFTTFEGDLISGSAGPEAAVLEWERANASVSILDADTHSAGVLPYSTIKANHGDAAGYLMHFGPARFEAPNYSWYGGHSDSGMSHYQIFTAGGRIFLHLGMQADGRTRNDERDWGESILNAHSDLPTIITTPRYLSGDLSKEINNWEMVKKHSQVFMMLNGGHAGEGWRGQAHQISLNDAGEPVFEMLSNMQGGSAWSDGFRGDGGMVEGWLRTITFIEGGGENGLDRIHMETYSPWLVDQGYVPTGEEYDYNYEDGYYRDQDGLAEADFYFDVDFDTRLGLTSVPEPSNSALLVLGILGLSWSMRHRKHRQSNAVDLECWARRV